MRDPLKPPADALDKSMPSALAGGQWTGTGFIDSYKRNRNPTPNELMAELKGAAWGCVSINTRENLVLRQPPRPP